MGTSDPGKFISFINNKCPKCRTGDMFGNSTFSLKKEILHKQCGHCDFKFEREPAYFHASMYVSYALNVAIIVAGSVATAVLTGSEDPWLYISVTIGLLVLLYPVVLRYSKTLLIYYMGGEYARYDSKKRIDGKKEKLTEII